MADFSLIVDNMINEISNWIKCIKEQCTEETYKGVKTVYKSKDAVELKHYKLSNGLNVYLGEDDEKVRITENEIIELGDGTQIVYEGDARNDEVEISTEDNQWIAFSRLLEYWQIPYFSARLPLSKEKEVMSNKDIEEIVIKDEDAEKIRSILDILELVLNKTKDEETYMNYQKLIEFLSKVKYYKEVEKINNEEDYEYDTPKDDGRYEDPNEEEDSYEEDKLSMDESSIENLKRMLEKIQNENDSKKKKVASLEEDKKRLIDKILSAMKEGEELSGQIAKLEGRRQK